MALTLTHSMCTASLLETSEGARVAAGAEWGGRRRRGSPDPGEDQKRPGWQVRYPGIEEKVEMANYVENGDSEEVSVVPDMDQQQAKAVRREAKKGKEGERLHHEF